MHANSTITLTMSRSEAALVCLALGYLIRERRKAPDEAARYLSEEGRPAYLQYAAETQAEAERIKDRIERDLHAGVAP